MESFSLLKYWRGGGSAGGASTTTTSSARVRTTTIAASVLRNSDTDDNDDDFFDLEFAVREEEDDDVVDTDSGDINYPVSEDETEMDKEFKFAISVPDGNHRSDQALSLSPSNDIFFKSRLVPNGHSAGSAPNTKLSQFPVSLRSSATKLRVLMLGLRRPKAPEAAGGAAPPKQQQLSRLFIKFKIEEVPIMSSLFSRDNSSRNRAAEGNPEAEEKMFTKEVVQKYINKIKPLYVRVSKRYGEKLRFSSEVEKADGAAAGAEGKRVVPKKRLGKSWSAPSAAVAAAPPSSTEALPPQRRDDSLLQQQDGIQSAIAHCKRSFNATRGSKETALVRSKSDPGGGDEASS